MKRKEYAPRDFQWTLWTVSDIKREADEFLMSKQKAYQKIKSISHEDRTFENTVYAIEASNHDIWKVHAMYLLMNVSPLKEIRNVAQNEINRIEKELVDIEYDKDIYQALKEYSMKKESLDKESSKLLNDMLREYKRMGFEISEKDRLQVKENLKRLSILSSKFSTNINEYHDHILVTRNELDGLSEGYISNLKREGEKYIVSLDYPDMVPFMENAKSSAKRKELAEKNLQKGGKENLEILKEIVRLRDENASLLGYDTHAAFRLEVKMAKDVKTVFDFMEDLIEKVGDGLKKELTELQELKSKIFPDDSKEVYFYDVSFLANELKKERLNIDAQKLREYFPLHKVLDGMFRVYETLFSVKFEEVSGHPSWYEDVKLYSVRELDGEIISYFFLDLYPREGKYGHAAAFEVISGHQKNFFGGEYVVPVASMVTNFPKPSKTHPSLLDHNEVVTLFHEFGHIMHEVLTKARFRSQAGFSTAWDFVEAPSQMLENWAWNKDVLLMISEHYQTGEILPQNMIDSLVQSKKHLIAYSTMRQMIFALFDMELHSRGISGELNEEYADMIASHTKITLPENQIFLAGWGHLTNYDAGYYGYMWSKVYASDMFSRFEKEGVLNPKTGMDYRKWILEQGSSRDEMELVEGFLGRKSNNEAFIQEMVL